MVKIYDNIIPKNICEILITTFEGNKKYQEYINDNNCPCFTQVNINEISKSIVKIIIPFVEQVYYQYKIDTQSKYIPPFKDLEEFRIKRYLTNGNERFDEHVDVVNYQSSKRSLAMLFYLNDVDSGGKTIFPYQNKEFTPSRGEVIIFPPTWEYPHLGEPPVSNPKYIMSTYLHYH